MEKCPDKSSKMIVSVLTEDIRSIKKSVISQILGAEKSTPITPLSKIYSPVNSLKDKKVYSTRHNPSYIQRLDTPKRIHTKYEKRLDLNRSMHDREDSFGSSKISS